MLRIAVCDDDIAELSSIVSVIEEYRAMNIVRHEIEYTSFASAIELIAAIESGARYHIILLDIVMPHINGIEAAAEIRLHDTVVKIIFLTSSAEFAVDSYAVGAFYYALKPIWADKLVALLDKAAAEIGSLQDQSLLVKCKTGFTRIPLHTLEYAEVMGRTIGYHLTNGSVLEGAGVMGELERELMAYPQFVKPHRSFLVNMQHIEDLRTNGIKTTTGNRIPVPKASFAKIKDAYLRYLFGGSE